MKRHIFPLLLITGVGIWCMKALFHEGLFTAHDIWHQVSRLYWYAESLSQGHFPQWIPLLANGYGYPLFVFSYHFPWLLGAPLVLLGVSIPMVLKSLFIFSFLLSGWGMYWCSFLVTKSRVAALVSALLYMVAPWRFVTIFVSAAMGRAFVFVLIPFIVGSFYLMSKTKKLVWSLCLAFCLSALVLSHLISAMTILVILIPLYFVLRPPVKLLFFCGLLVLCLTSWYLGPLISLSHSIKASQPPFSQLYLDQFVSFKQLLYSPWGYGIVTGSAKTGPFSFQLGFAQWAAVLLTICFIVVKKTIQKHKLIPLTTSFVIALVVCLFLVTDASRPLWRIGAHFTTFDYPTMFLMPAVFLSSFLAGVVVLMAKKAKLVFAFFFVLLAFLNNRNYLRVNQYMDVSVSDIVAAETTTNTYHEYLPLTADIDVMAQNTLGELSGILVSHANIERNTHTYQALFTAEQEGLLSLKVFAFPHLKLQLDGAVHEYHSDSIGRIQLYVTKGEHQIKVTY